jgi:hypothetical protein
MDTATTRALYPTKTRLNLLRAVRDGWILDDPRDGHTYWVDPPDDPFRVDARVREAERAGWIVLDVEDGINWHLADAGQAVLTEAGS